MIGALGAKGEKLAQKEYQKRGYTILKKNYRTRQGEVDFIAYHQGCYVFVEVKSRGSTALAPGRESVTYRKQQRLVAAARQFLQQNRLSDPWLRFDVVEVYQTKDTYSIVVIENAFTL